MATRTLLRRLAVVLASLAVATSAQLTSTVAFAANTTGSGGGLAITTTDPAGTVLVGTCFELYADAGGGTRGALVANSKRCDQPVRPGDKPGPNDGLIDGTTPWTGLAAGSYVVRETLGPALAGTAATYELAPDTAVRISTGEVARLTLAHRPTAGLTIHKVDARGRPLPGACFVLITPDRQVAGVCDGPPVPGQAAGADRAADGLIVIPGLAPTLKPTTYTLRELVAPPGYAPAPDQQVVADPARPTELTITNTTGSAPAPQPTGGATQVTGIDLEIRSTISITAITGYSTNGTTTASGTIPLTSGSNGTWSGVGNLAAKTGAKGGACPAASIAGEGTYDWLVREVHAGPELVAADIDVSMDSGPLNETPDTVTIDDCSLTTDSPMSTWESLFFDVYRPKFGSFGFLVDGWQILDANAWTAGGPVAEAHWAGDCGSSQILGCSDQTTFRLIVRVGPATAGATKSPTPVATSDGGAVGTTPGLTQPPGSGPVSDRPPLGCTDFMSCVGQYAIFVLIGAVTLVGGGLLLWQRLASTTPAPADTRLDADKFGDADAWKLGDGSSSLGDGTVELGGTVKIGDVKVGDGSLPPLEPPGSDLPPEPGSIG